MKYGGLKMCLSLALVLTWSQANASAQGAAGGVTKEEEAEARATAAAFAERLKATQDFAAVARELYADDFISRQVKGLSGWAQRAGSPTFMLEAIPSLNFDRALASKASAEDWKRVRLAADSLLYYMFLSLLSNHSFEEWGDAEKYDARALLGVFPPEAVKALNANPSASNFLLKKNDEVVIKTPEELRALASALEEAGRLTRPGLAGSLAKGKHLEANLRLIGQGFGRGGVKLAEGEEELAGYPAGTRLFRVSAPNAYSLLLVRQGGAMKIVYAGLPHD